MNYKFSDSIHGIKGMFGVEYDSLEPAYQALFEINSHVWTPEEVQSVIDNSNALQGEDEFVYQVEGGHLYIIVDPREVYFYNTLNNDKEEEDFRLPFSEFITFMTDFKNFTLQKR